MSENKSLDDVVADIDYYSIIHKSWENFLKDVEDFEYHHSNEEDIRCYLFAKCYELLKIYERNRLVLHADDKIMDKTIDLTLSSPSLKTVAVAMEIKYNPDPQKIEEDLRRLRELLEKKKIHYGLFVTLALSKYELKKRLKDLGILEKFGLKEEGSSNYGYVEWRTIQRPTPSDRPDLALVDALFICLETRSTIGGPGET